MADSTLIAENPLRGFDRNHAGIVVAEISGFSLVSIASPLGGEDALRAAIHSWLGISWPQVGSSTFSRKDKTRLLGLQRDQIFAMFDHPGDHAVRVISNQLGEAGYYTDQTDSWVMLRVSGAKSRTALERICPIDLDPKAFSPGAVTRTVMEHHGAIILRDGQNSFVLLSARSSARSFLRAVERSVDNIDHRV